MSFHKKAINDNDFMYQSCKSATEAVNRKINIVNVWNDEVPFRTRKRHGNKRKICISCHLKKRPKTCLRKNRRSGNGPYFQGSDRQGRFPVSRTYRIPGTPGRHGRRPDDDGKRLTPRCIGNDPRSAERSARRPDERKNCSENSAVEASLRKDFGILKPRIAVFGVNPHAGENGKMGTEESEIITPAINQAKSEDMLVYGLSRQTASLVRKAVTIQRGARHVPRPGTGSIQCPCIRGWR